MVGQSALSEIAEGIRRESDWIKRLIAEIEKVIVGQRYMIERLLVSLLANGHVLIEGVPGLAKTLTAKVFAETIQAKFQRIQFTPDLLPADLIGTLVYNPKEGEFRTKPGPIFAHFVLADEVNRAPAKVQSALLEAMQEKQVTIGEQTFRLEEPFLVLATQNPIEHEGTYPLPEAQKDRFLMKINLTYPDMEGEREILRRRAYSLREWKVTPQATKQDVLRARSLVDRIYMDEKIERYILQLIFATRNPKKFGLEELEGLIQYGASPRATIHLATAVKAFAFVQGRGYVTPQDVKSLGPDVLRHRLILSYEAVAEEKTPDDVIQKILDHVEIP